MLIFALMLVAAESGAPTAGVAEAVVNVEYKYINCPPSSQWDPRRQRCVHVRLGYPARLQPPPVCRSDQVLIAGKVCGCPAQTRAKALSPGVFKCLPYP